MSSGSWRAGVPAPYSLVPTVAKDCEMDIMLREATDRDGDAVAAVIARCFADYPGIVFDRAAEFPELDAIASHFAAGGGRIWVAELGGRVVGSFAIAVSDEPGVMELHKVYLLPELRGRGLARRMLGRALDFAAACGAVEIKLWTDTRFDAGHRFYEANGFVRQPGIRTLNDLSNSREYAYRRPVAALAA
jgi:putative acetyltransferase